MKLLATFTKGRWADVLAAESEFGSGCGEDLRKHLTEFLRSRNLVVLAGLGTSLCIKGPDGLGAAPTMGDLWKKIVDRVSTRTFNDICARVRQPEIAGDGYAPDIEMLLSKCLLAQEYAPSMEVADFIQVAEAEIVQQCSFLNEHSVLEFHETFLRRIARRSTRHPRTKLFTTNYDQAFETAASKIHFTVIDGFSHTIPQEFNSGYFAYDLVRREEDGEASTFVPNVFHLYKLHGSVDWQQEGEAIVKSVSPKSPVLIYPRHSKFELSYESPFLDLMSRFQASLRQSETSLLIIGFGFNDKHLTQPLLSAIRGNVGLRTLVVAPSLEGSQNSAIATIERLILTGDTRLGLVNGTFEEFVPYLPDLVADSEEDRHQRRIRGDA